MEDACVGDCVEAFCGDGWVQEGEEECDDGNDEAGDGCRANCTLEAINITGGRQHAYGHHGQCSGWNGCGNAQTCANWACQLEGRGTAVSFDVATHNCAANIPNWHLFRNQGNIHRNWTNNCNWCPLQGVTNIMCTP
jgi:cysteine-rich repeat protein